MIRSGAKAGLVLMVLGTIVIGWAWRRGSNSPRSRPGPSGESSELVLSNVVRARDARDWLRSGRAIVRDSAPVGEPGQAGGPGGRSPLERVVAALIGAEGGDAEALALPREALERWLESGRTNAADLLAARQAGGGSEYLRRALEAFPDDPRVLIQATVLEDPPEVMRQRLDRLKAVAPDNSLADYLSAKDHLKNGRIEEGLADLRAASGKKGFQDYSMEAALNGEELYLQSGASAVEAKAMGTSTVLLPQLTELKELAVQMANLQRQYLQSGDRASAEALGQLGYQLTQRLSTDPSPHMLMHELVGSALERIVLRGLPADSTPEFLGTGVGAYLDEQLAPRRQELQALGSGFADWLPLATETDIISYFDRMKSQGEIPALKWLRERVGKKP